MEYTLAIDQGTHASRALLYDTHGYCRYRQIEQVSLQRLADGRVEQNAGKIISATRSCIDAVLAELSASHRQAVTRCGITTQRSTVLAWRGDDGSALSAALSWQDTRGASHVKALDRYSDAIHRLSGLPLSAHYGASKLRWLYARLHAEPALRLGPLSAFLTARLCDNPTPVVDHSNAQRTQLLDIQQRSWSRQLADWFEVPLDRLPDCAPVQHEFGALLDYGIPVTAVCGDQNAAWFSDGLPDEDCARVNLGSGAFILAAQTSAAAPALLSSVASSTDTNISYLTEGTVNGGGNAIQWLQQQAGVADISARLDDWLNTVHQPPVFINTVGGLGSPWWRNDIDPVFLPSAGSGNSTAEYAVAVVESIAFLVQKNLEQIRKTHSVQRLYLSGGLSRLGGLCQKLANLSGLPASRSDDSEASARGIAWLAGGQQQDWPAGMSTQFFTPRSDSGLMKRYQLFCDYLAQQ